mgnify:FL=1
MPSSSRRRAPGELGAVVVCDADSGAFGHPGEYRQLRSDVLPGGLVRDDPGHEEPGLPFSLGVQVASHADHAVGLPMAGFAPVSGRSDMGVRGRRRCSTCRSMGPS